MFLELERKPTVMDQGVVAEEVEVLVVGVRRETKEPATPSFGTVELTGHISHNCRQNPGN